MKKMMLLFAILMFVPTLVFAHTGLESSNPAEGSEVIEKLGSIELNFNSSVQQGSIVTVIDESGQETPVKSIEIHDNILNVYFEQPLSNGEYKVKWDIISADSHPVSGEYSFTVNVEEVEQETPLKEADTNQDEITDQESTNDQVENGLNSKTETKTDESQSNVGVLLIGAVIIVILLFVLIARRKKK
jgi:copper resistance protein C